MRRWADAGVLDRLFDALQDHRTIRVSVDCLVLGSTSIKVHPDSAGAPKKRPASDWKISLRMKQW
ncbi:MAG: hypothetical protein P8O08_18300 [Paracoccaceae bacterium]|nr:hypothetical protein [Paracoccaceae bacterium]